MAVAPCVRSCLEKLRYFDADIREKIQALSVEQLERLSIDVLACSTVAEFARHVRGNACEA